MRAGLAEKRPQKMFIRKADCNIDPRKSTVTAKPFCYQVLMRRTARSDVRDPGNDRFDNAWAGQVEFLVLLTVISFAGSLQEYISGGIRPKLMFEYCRKGFE